MCLLLEGCRPRAPGRIVCNGYAISNARACALRVVRAVVSVPCVTCGRVAPAGSAHARQRAEDRVLHEASALALDQHVGLVAELLGVGLRHLARERDRAPAFGHERELVAFTADCPVTLVACALDPRLLDGVVTHATAPRVVCVPARKFVRATR